MSKKFHQKYETLDAAMPIAAALRTVFDDVEVMVYPDGVTVTANRDGETATADPAAEAAADFMTYLGKSATA
jgi:hypothetical protein